MTTIFELLVTCAAVMLPIVTVIAVLSGKRTLGIVAFVFSILSVFLYGLGMGFHSQSREARRMFHDKITEPHRLIVAHLQSLAEQGNTNELRHALGTLSQYDLHLFPDRNHLGPELIDVFRELQEQQRKGVANKTPEHSSEGCGRPSENAHR